MMIFKKWVFLSIPFLFCLAAKAGELNVPSLDSRVEDLLSRHVEMIGGKPALEMIKVQRITGFIERNGNKVPHIRTQKGPNLLLVETRFPRPGTLKQGFNGKQGWVLHPLQGGRILLGKELELFASQAWLHPSLHVKEIYTIREWLGNRTFENKKYTAISMARKKGSTPETWYFDTASALLSRIEQRVDGGPQGEIPVEIVFSDYRKVSGVMVPYLTRTTTGKENPTTSIFKVEKVEHNVEVNDAIFNATF